jgi:hypothetical protein
LTPLASPVAQVAQLVEHATENRSVGGSIPPLGTIFAFLTALKWLREFPKSNVLDERVGGSWRKLSLFGRRCLERGARLHRN